MSSPAAKHAVREIAQIAVFARELDKMDAEAAVEQAIDAECARRTEGLVEALKAAMACIGEQAVEMDSEIGEARSLEELDRAGVLPREYYEARAALAAAHPDQGETP